MEKILIIENEQNIAEALRDLFLDEGFEVFTALSGKEGISLVESNMPDLIICDIMMPEMDGYQVLEQLRKNPVTYTIPFLFLTAKSDKSDLRHGMHLGADDYITKPYDDDDLLKAVRSRLEKYEAVKNMLSGKLNEQERFIASALPKELRNPLNTILGFTQILKNRISELQTSEVSNLLDNILDAGKRLLKLIVNYSYYTTLLDLSLSDTKYPEMHTKHSESIIYTTALEIAKEYIRVNDITLQIEQGTLHIAGSHLSKIIKELVGNAFKNTEKGSEITVKTKFSENQFSLEVINPALNLTKEQIKAIAPIKQFTPEDLHSQKPGLGLAIVKKICDIYNGKLSINAEEGKDVVVRIELPNEEKK